MAYLKETYLNMKKILFVVLMIVISYSAYSQSGTNSPYSQYGLGVLADQTSGFNRGMNGIGIGFREPNQINFINPASYSSMDSLTFIFDAGISGQITNFNEKGKKVNAKNADFEYAVAGFRIRKHVGLSFGILPFSNIGYNYSGTEKVGSNSTTTYTNTYSGSGGLHQVYVGAGWEFAKGLSVGFNAGYLWGELNRSVTNSYNETSINTLSKYYNVEVRSYNVNFGLQYTAELSSKNAFTLGLTYTLGHKLGCDPQVVVSSENSSTGIIYADTLTIKNGLKIPSMIGAGLMWSNGNRLKLGIDYSLQKWGDMEFPQYSITNGKSQYALTKGLFNDRHKINFGGEYCSNPISRNFFSRIRYRAGISYATPYLKINGQDGPKEISISAGFGIPIFNTWNNRSILNISAQWVNQSAKNMIKENTFRINIGITFNERWFMKWKVE